MLLTLLQSTHLELSVMGGEGNIIWELVVLRRRYKVNLVLTEVYPHTPISMSYNLH